MARALDEQDLLDLVDALASGQWQSGEALAAGAGLTRAGLAKRMAHLRDWGLDIESKHGQGYRLTQPLERLDAARLRADLPADLGLEVLPLVDSTNRLLAAADARQDPQAVLAEYQSAGRGRRGREWRSPFGANLYLSIAWSYPMWPPQLPALSLAVGVVCARALRAAGVAGVQLKWPNDLWVGDRKLGGILIEQRGESSDVCRVVVGVGVNVAMQASQAASVDQPWTTVDEVLGREPGGPRRASRNALAAELLRGLHDCLSRYALGGFEPYRREWLALDAMQGREVQVPGDETLRGPGRGIDASGAFLIETATGLRAVHAGDVSLRLR
ncbi:MAG: biotin--[acetyl-CoA-carboxylase] ligase [Panacagrimonas sp.]